MALAKLVFFAFVADFVGAGVATILWSWFVSELFGLPGITVFHVIGIRLLTGYLLPSGGKMESISNEDYVKYLVEAPFRKIMLAVLILIFGFLVHLFVV